MSTSRAGRDDEGRRVLSASGRGGEAPYIEKKRITAKFGSCNGFRIAVHYIRIRSQDRAEYSLLSHCQKPKVISRSAKNPQKLNAGYLGFQAKTGNHEGAKQEFF